MKTDKEEIKKVYDRLSEIYHNKRLVGRDFNELIEQPTTFSLLGKITGKKILDAGCGSGIYSKILAKKGAKVYALEISKKMVDLAKDYCKGDNIQFKYGSIDKLPYKNNSFDIVLASLVIHYLKNPEKAFEEFNRVLKKNGILIFSTNNPSFTALEEIKSMRGKNKMIIFNYFKRGKYYWKIKSSNIRIPSYRISFEELFDMLYKNNFIIEKFKEPYLTNKEKRIQKHSKRFIGIPTFIVLRCRKFK